MERIILSKRTQSIFLLFFCYVSNKNTALYAFDRQIFAFSKEYLCRKEVFQMFYRNFYVIRNSGVI